MISTVLVTGGAGFIGSHTCEALLCAGYKVVCIDNFSDYYNPLQKEKNIQECILSDDFYLERGDICDREFLDIVFKKYKPDAVVHLAAAVGVRHSIRFPELYSQINVVGTESVLFVAEKYKTNHIIFASSSSVYGERVEGPFVDGLLITEKPLSVYAETKMLGEHLLFRWHAITGNAVTCFRFFTVYGPRGRRDMFPYILADRISRCEPITQYGNGDSMRDYTYVTDIADAIVASISKNIPGFHIMNLGNGNPVSLSKVIAIFESVIGKSAQVKIEPHHQADVFITHALIDQAQQKIAFHPKVDFEQGVRRFIEWFNSDEHIPD